MIDFKSCFISRPRRFGKTLLADTAEEMFKGSRELFEGLEIASVGYRFGKRPVIRLDMSCALAERPEQSKTCITATPSKVAISEGRL
jgi:hypothetical protein